MSRVRSNKEVTLEAFAMTDTGPREMRGRVERIMFTPNVALMLEAIRIAHNKASVEAVLHEGLVDLANQHGITVPNIELTDERREKIAAEGVLDHDNVVSLKSARRLAQEKNRGYAELVIFYDGNENWVQSLMQLLDCDMSALISMSMDKMALKIPPER